MSDNYSARATTKMANAAFVPIGIVTVLLGPLLPILSAGWSLNYLQAGSLFTVQFVGSTIAVSLSGSVISRFGFRFAMGVGLFAMALGVGALPFTSRSGGLVCIACYGIGLGLAIPAINLLVAALNVACRSAALSLLNFWWSVGAVACPFLVAEAARTHQIKLFLTLLAIVLALTLLLIALAPSFAEPDSKTEPHEKTPLVRWNWRSGSILAALFFLYVGAENAFGGWIASYAKSLGSTSAATSAIMPSFFYAALMAGRWVAPAVLRRMDELTAVRVALCVAGFGMAALVLSRTVPLVAGSVSIAGLGLALVYPVTISRLSQEFGATASRGGSVMFAMSNVGGAVLPWLVGYGSQKLGSLGAGLVVPLVATAAMAALYFWPWKTRPAASSSG